MYDDERERERERERPPPCSPVLVGYVLDHDGGPGVAGTRLGHRVVLLANDEPRIEPVPALLVALPWPSTTAAAAIPTPLRLLPNAIAVPLLGTLPNNAPFVAILSFHSLISMSIAAAQTQAAHRRLDFRALLRSRARFAGTH